MLCRCAFFYSTCCWIRLRLLDLNHGCCRGCCNLKLQPVNAFTYLIHRPYPDANPLLHRFSASGFNNRFLCPIRQIRQGTPNTQNTPDTSDKFPIRKIRQIRSVHQIHQIHQIRPIAVLRYNSCFRHCVIAALCHT